MIDLHTHSLLSDGELLPSELVRRAEAIGYKAIAITDHSDASNLDFVVERIIKVCSELKGSGIPVIPGVELTHIPPQQIERMVRKARALGARLVVAHGETIVEPVSPGTNRAAIHAGIDILAHPGLISEEDAGLAAEKSVYLELSARKGHSLSNGHVAKVSKKFGVNMVLNTDSHAPSDLINDEMAMKIIVGAGLTEDDFRRITKNAEEILQKVMGYGL
ncbi:MAG: histidinol phosphate phosphatase domain-containing protein [Deltaproteobacteria bacterium]|nr:histidinol phosphate phosphatase domain-containing protein [Deltaproteobacteria bacterium]